MGAVRDGDGWSYLYYVPEALTKAPQDPRYFDYEILETDLGTESEAEYLAPRGVAKEHILAARRLVEPNRNLVRESRKLGFTGPTYLNTKFFMDPTSPDFKVQFVRAASSDVEVQGRKALKELLQYFLCSDFEGYIPKRVRNPILGYSPSQGIYLIN